MLVLSPLVSLLLFLYLSNFKNNTVGKVHKILTDISLIIVSVVPVQVKRDIGFLKNIFCVKKN